MGGADHIPQLPILDFLESKGKHINPLWRKVLEAQAKRRWLGSWKQRVNNVGLIKGLGNTPLQYPFMMIKNTRPSTSRRNYLMMKRRRAGRVEGSRRPTRNGMERKVRSLKKLIPNGESSMSLDGIFRETADYILSLQMRVRVMQFMVDALSGSDV